MVLSLLMGGGYSCTYLLMPLLSVARARWWMRFREVTEGRPRSGSLVFTALMIIEECLDHSKIVLLCMAGRDE